MAGAITAGVIVGGAALAGAYMSSEAAKAAAKAQVGASQDASAVSYKISQEQLAAQKEALDKQILAAGSTVDKQLLVQRDTLNQQLAFQQKMYDQTREDFAPYRESGTANLNQLNTLLGIGGNTGATDFGRFKTADFTPADFEAGKDPGYAFRIREGLKAIDRQAASRGGLISGNALKGAASYSSDLASQEYQNAFNRFQAIRGNTLQPFQMGAAAGQSAAAMQGQANANFGSAGGQAIANAGQGASSAYGALGTGTYNAVGNYGQNATGILGAYGTNVGNNLIGAGNARASGYVGSSNAINSGVSNLANSYYQNKMLDMFKNSPRGLERQYGADNIYGSGFNNYQPSGPTNFSDMGGGGFYPVS
jgi:hypothetical protein